jgi:hypothetical protein
VYKIAVENWLRHEDITNLKLTAISFWHNNKTIKQFLAESTLGNECNSRGQRLRIDMGWESCAPKACRGGSKRIPLTLLNFSCSVSEDGLIKQLTKTQLGELF